MSATNIKILVLLIIVPLSHTLWAVCDSNNARYNTSIDTTAHGIVLDKNTGLMWKRCPQGATFSLETNRCSSSGTHFNWRSALESATQSNELSFANYNDWRVPNIKELRSIAHYSCTDSVFDTTIFPTIADTSAFWSSSINVNSPTQSWQLVSQNGKDLVANRHSNAKVLLVRQ